MLAENWPALSLFLDAQTQWRHAGMSGIPTGLDYPGVRAAADMAGVTITPPLFEDLRGMEDEALLIFVERRSRS
ncbi:DUF1799 domain-containing protein [Hypericibacter sp.]|uniref:DUF1799 domain-containing protein n=1 Tax=Hypericibacter sp. TaxID=2705401 RepID=UPI003D6D077E